METNKVLNELAKKYGLSSIEEYIEEYSINGERLFYQDFLIATDYIGIKIMEGAGKWEDYKEEKTYRQVAREQLNNM